MFPWKIIPLTCIGHQFRRYVEHLLHCEIFRILDGMLVVWVFPPHEYWWFLFNTWTFSMSQNVFRCLLSHSLKIVFAFFALPKMVWILTTNPILFRRLQWWIAVPLLLIEGKQRVSPFYRDFLLLPKWRTCVHEGNVDQTSVLLFEGKQRGFHHFISFPLLRRPSFVSSHPEKLAECVLSTIRRWWPGKWLANNGFLRSIILLGLHTPRTWTFVTSLCGLSDAEDDRVEGALAIKFIIGLDLAVTLSSHESLFVLFAIPWEQTENLKWLTLTNTKDDSIRNVWNCLRVAFWCQCTWFGSKLIWSNNQSRATPWVLETCRIVGLLPLMIILITASLSSNTYNKASWREDWTFEGTESIISITLIFPWDFWCFLISLNRSPCSTLKFERRFQRTETIRSHNSRASKPSNLNPVSKEMISVREVETSLASSLPLLAESKFWELATSWELILSGSPDLSRSVSPFLTDCAVPSRRNSSWSGRTFRTILQEVSSGPPDRSYSNFE